MTRKRKSSLKSPASEIIERLQLGLGTSWTVTMHSVNSLDFGLPQSRPRLCFVGRRLVLCPNGCPSGLPEFVSRMKLEAALVPDDVLASEPAGSGRPYTALCNQNIDDWKKACKQMMFSESCAGQCLVVAADRTPTNRTAWGGTLPKPGIFPCLTATGPMLHILSAGEGSRNLSIDRPVHKFERGAVQGFPRSVCKFPMKDAVAKKWLGTLCLFRSLVL